MLDAVDSAVFALIPTAISVVGAFSIWLTVNIRRALRSLRARGRRVTD